MTPPPNSATLERMTYPGGKAAPGVYQTIINQIPPHHTYIEPFLGDGAVLRRIRPAARTIGVESDDQVLATHWSEMLPGGNAESVGQSSLNLELYRCDGIAWLQHFFGLHRWTPSGTGS